MANLTSYVSFLYDHWMASYCDLMFKKKVRPLTFDTPLYIHKFVTPKGFWRIFIINPIKKLKEAYTNLKKNESEQLRQQEQKLKNFLFQEII